MEQLLGAAVQVMAKVKKFFRPELLNRLDDIVIFDPLTTKQLLGVARLLAEELNERLKNRWVQSPGFWGMGRV